jgi:hypothetical protein
VSDTDDPADSFVTSDGEPARAVSGLAQTATIDALRTAWTGGEGPIRLAWASVPSSNRHQWTGTNISTGPRNARLAHSETEWACEPFAAESGS